MGIFAFLSLNLLLGSNQDIGTFPFLSGRNGIDPSELQNGPAFVIPDTLDLCEAA